MFGLAQQVASAKRIPSRWPPAAKLIENMCNAISSICCGGFICEISRIGGSGQASSESEPWRMVAPFAPLGSPSASSEGHTVMSKSSIPRAHCSASRRRRSKYGSPCAQDYRANFPAPLCVHLGALGLGCWLLLCLPGGPGEPVACLSVGQGLLAHATSICSIPAEFGASNAFLSSSPFARSVA